MIESVEGRKEGYESDVDEGNNDLDFPGDDNLFRIFEVFIEIYKY